MEGWLAFLKELGVAPEHVALTTPRLLVQSPAPRELPHCPIILPSFDKEYLNALAEDEEVELPTNEL